MVAVVAVGACDRSGSRRNGDGAAGASRDSSIRGGPPAQPRLVQPETLTTLTRARLDSFRRAAGPSPDTLAGPRSRDTLVARWAAALVRRDTTALRALTLTPREFAWLYYPLSPTARPPYDLDPDLMWLQIESRSGRGMRRAVARRAAGFAYRGYACEDSPRQLGPVRLWDRCLVRHETGGRVVAEQLFGSIIERDGRYKLVGLSNGL